MDKHLDLLELQFRFVTARLFECEAAVTKWSQSEIRRTQHVLRSFLKNNANLMRLAADEYAKLTEDQRTDLCKKHRLTESLVPANQGADYIYQALLEAESAAWNGDGETLVWYDAAMVEMIPRVLSYAKYIAPSGNLRADMCPIEDFLPRHLRREARIESRAPKAIVSVWVHGGRGQENKSAFDSLNLPEGVERASTVAIGTPEESTPFHIVLYCDAATLPALMNELRSHEFTIE